MKSLPQTAPAGATQELIDELTAVAVDHHRKAFQAARVAVEEAWHCGDALNEIKPLVGHGNWLPWLEKHGIAHDRAKAWMKLARRYTLAATARFDNVTDALGALSKALPPPDDEPAKKWSNHYLHQNGASEPSKPDAVEGPKTAPGGAFAEQVPQHPETGPPAPSKALPPPPWGKLSPEDEARLARRSPEGVAIGACNHYYPTIRETAHGETLWPAFLELAAQADWRDDRDEVARQWADYRRDHPHRPPPKPKPKAPAGLAKVVARVAEDMRAALVVDPVRGPAINYKAVCETAHSKLARLLQDEETVPAQAALDEARRKARQLLDEDREAEAWAVLARIEYEPLGYIDDVATIIRAIVHHCPKALEHIKRVADEAAELVRQADG